MNLTIQDAVENAFLREILLKKNQGEDKHAIQEDCAAEESKRRGYCSMNHHPNWTLEEPQGQY